MLIDYLSIIIIEIFLERDTFLFEKDNKDRDIILLFNDN